jgi:hypothetical protein
MNAQLRRDLWLCSCVVFAFASIISVLFSGWVFLENPTRFLGDLVGREWTRGPGPASMTWAHAALALPTGFALIAWWCHSRYQRALRVRDPERELDLR